MKARKCLYCLREVPEDEICQCLKNKIQLKRDELKTKDSSSEIHCLIVNKEERLVMQVSEELLNDHDRCEELAEFFAPINILFLKKDIQLSIVKSGEEDVK